MNDLNILMIKAMTMNRVCDTMSYFLSMNENFSRLGNFAGMGAQIFEQLLQGYIFDTANNIPTDKLPPRAVACADYIIAIIQGTESLTT